MDLPFPPTPESIPPDLARPGPRYRRHAWTAGAALVAFIALYLGLLAWFVHDIHLAVLSLGSPEGALGVGVAIPSLILLLWLLRGLFFLRRGGEIDDLEVTRTDEPVLFGFLDRLADEVGSPRPHRIFLTADVNAAVFYDVSFWNLVFPSKKNLRLGFGLLNVLTLDELKAVLAHELGHFAQRTMAVGTWVYVSGQVVGAVVARRDGFDRFMDGLSRTDFRIAWVGWALRLLVWSIRVVLDTAFRGVIYVQRALSREMEFQADLVAASVTGSDSLVHALRRLGPADDALGRAFSFAASEAVAGRRVADVYAVQTEILGHLRRVMDDPHLGLVPPRQTGTASARLFSPELAEAPRMWATHPADHEREENLKRTYVRSFLDARPAWLVLGDSARRRREMTDRFYTRVPAAKDKPALAMGATKVEIERVWDRPRFAERYRGVYVGRSVVRTARTAPELRGTPPPDAAVALAELYPGHLVDTMKAWRAAEAQCAQLEALERGVLQAPGGLLRFGGRDIPVREVSRVLGEACAHRDALRKELAAHDKAVRSAHLAAAEALGRGWPNYLKSCAAAVHYLEHAEADLADAKRALDALWTVITADKKVDEGEIRRLLVACEQLFLVLEPVYTRAPEVFLPPEALATLRVPNWAAMLEPFRLGQPTRAALANNWLPAAETWVNLALGALDRAAAATLDALLTGEATVAAAYTAGTDPGAAPPPASGPATYGTLLPGEERPRPKLSAWDRFQTADGLGVGALRLAAAGSILTPGIFASWFLGTGSLLVHNGLDTKVVVHVEEHRVALDPGAESSLRLRGRVHVRTTTADGREIESFDAEVSPKRTVYNVAGGDGFYTTWIRYGSGDPPQPTALGAERWFTPSAQYVGETPPTSISGDHDENRSVLAALFTTDPSTRITATPHPEAMILAHLTWDDADTSDLATWAGLARMGKIDAGPVLRARAAKDSSVALHRVWQEVDPEAACAEDDKASKAHPNDPDALYLALRCQPDERSGDAFIAAAAGFPGHPYLIWAAAYALDARGEYTEEERLLSSVTFPRELAEQAARSRLLLARLAHADVEKQTRLAEAARLGDTEREALATEASGMPPSGLSSTALSTWAAQIGQYNQASQSHDPGLRWLLPCSDGGPTSRPDVGLPTVGSLGDTCRILLAANDGTITPTDIPAFVQANPGMGAMLAPIAAAPSAEVVTATDAACANKPLSLCAYARLFGRVRLGPAAPASWTSQAHALLPTARWFVTDSEP